MTARVSARLRTALSAAIVLFAAPEARAAARPLNIALEYERGDGAEACPDAAHFEPLVRARVGRDPFVAPADLQAQVRIVRVARELVGTVDVKGSVRRELRSASADCDELAASLALALAVRIDPASFVSPPPSPPPSSQAGETAPPAEGRDPAPTAERAPSEGKPLSGISSIGAVGVLGGGPQPTAGATIQVGVRGRILSLALEGRGDLPSEEVLASGARVRAGILAASLVPCLHHRFLLGCLLATGGVLRASGESVLEAKSESAPLFAIGARAGAEVRVAGPFFVRIHVDVLAPLTRATLRIDGAPAWRTPAFSGALGAAFGLTF